MRLNELVTRQSKPAAGRASMPQQPQSNELEVILEIIRRINRSLVLSEVLEMVLDNAIKIAKAERGFLMLANQGMLEFVLARDSAGRSLPHESFTISRSIVFDVFQTGEAMFIEHAQEDSRMNLRQSIASLALETILCAPLATYDEKIGVIYVDSRHIQSINKASILNLFEILAGQAAIAIKNARLYERLRHAFDALENANDRMMRTEKMALRGEMASEVSHELRNLVNVTLLQVQALQHSFKREHPDSSAASFDAVMEHVTGGLQRIQRYAEDLLKNSGLVTTRTKGDLNAAVRDFTTFISTLSKYREVSFDVKIAEALPGFEFDGEQLQQVLLNLVTNAVEARPDASITISTGYDPRLRMVALRVADNGPGIPEAIRNRLFHAKVTTKPDGNGFGLAICKKIAQNHGGTVDVESTEGVGSTFTVYLSTIPI